MSSVLRLRLGARTSYRRDATFNLRRRLLRPLPSLSPPVLADWYFMLLVLLFWGCIMSRGVLSPVDRSLLCDMW